MYIVAFMNNIKGWGGEGQEGVVWSVGVGGMGKRQGEGEGVGMGRVGDGGRWGEVGGRWDEVGVYCCLWWRRDV